MSAPDATRPVELVNAVAKVDQTFLFIFGVSAVLLLLITAAMVWFVFRYSRKRNPVAATFAHNTLAEVVWIVLPTILVMGMFWSGWVSYRALRDAPPDSLEIKVTARMWSWDFEYPDGKHSPVLVVPAGRPVKLAMTSVDVLHGFFAPAFRMKIDTVPGMTTYGWFRADKEGEYVIFCSVYCGLQHAKMLSSIRAVPQEEYERFLAEKGGGAGGSVRELLDAKGCLSCHSLDGTPSVGPSLKDVWGREAVLVGKDKKEKKLKYDAASLTMIIMGPRAGVVKGFDAVMPEYKDQISPEELKQILEFLEKGEAGPASGPEAWKAVAEGQGCLGCHSLDGSDVAGPTFKGMFGRKGLAKGGGVVDRAYIEAVLKDPAAKLGRASVMPAYPQLAGADLEAVMKLLESEGAVPGPVAGVVPVDHAKHEADGKPGKQDGKDAGKGGHGGGDHK